MNVETIARICHEVNRAYCTALGDYSPQPWVTSPMSLRDKTIAGVRFLLDHPGSGPDALHANWMQAMLASGWRYGPVKDEQQLQHPNLVDFIALPRDQQAKDHLFLAIVQQLRDL